MYDENGQKHSPVSQFFAKAPNFSLAKLDGISKVMLAYGYRVGFITFFLNSVENSVDGAPFTPEFQKGMRAEAGTKLGGFIRGEISQVNHHGQILADALFDDWKTVEEQRGNVIKMLAGRWQKFASALEENYKKYGKEKVWADPCNGGFFCYLNLAKGIDARLVAERLLTEKKVGVVPSGNGLRLAFAGVAEGKITVMVNAAFEVIYNSTNI